jgi:hypothetical protein
MATKRQLVTLAKNLIAKTIILDGNYEYPSDLLSHKDMVTMRKLLDDEALKMTRRVYRIDSNLSSTREIVKEVFKNVK